MSLVDKVKQAKDLRSAVEILVDYVYGLCLTTYSSEIRYAVEFNSTEQKTMTELMRETTDYWCEVFSNPKFCSDIIRLYEKSDQFSYVEDDGSHDIDYYGGFPLELKNGCAILNWLHHSDGECEVRRMTQHAMVIIAENY
jgi:hypothetical protein